MRKVQFVLGEEVLKDVSEEAQKMSGSTRKFVSTTNMMKILIREAIAGRRSYPEVADSLHSLRLKYDKVLYERGDTSVFQEEGTQADEVKLKSRTWKRKTVNGLPLSISDVVEAINSLGKVAHTKEVAFRLKITETNAQARLVRALERKIVHRLDWGLYTTKIPTEADMLTGALPIGPAEIPALERARQYVLKSRGLG